MHASLFLWVLIVLLACLASGCTSIGAVELARDALARCQHVERIEMDGGRVYDSASTRIACSRSLP